MQCIRTTALLATGGGKRERGEREERERREERRERETVTVESRE